VLVLSRQDTRQEGGLPRKRAPRAGLAVGYRDRTRSRGLVCRGMILAFLATVAGEAQTRGLPWQGLQPVRLP
jgi:hypothetical protein